MTTQKGFTLVEVLIVLAIAAWLAAVGGIGYAIVHFVMKFW